MNLEKITERRHGRAFHGTLRRVQVNQLPVGVRRPRAHVRQVRPDAQTSKLHRIVVKIILRDAVPPAPAARNVGAGGNNVDFGLSASGGDFIHGSIGGHLVNGA